MNIAVVVCVALQLSAGPARSVDSAANIAAPLQQPADMFKDVPQSHWCYEAAESLLKSGLIWGYPRGYFSGKRILTRYEFAVAMDRALRSSGIAHRLPDFERYPHDRDSTYFLHTVDAGALIAMIDEFRAELGAFGEGSLSIEPARQSLLDAWEQAVTVGLDFIPMARTSERYSQKTIDRTLPITLGFRPEGYDKWSYLNSLTEPATLNTHGDTVLPWK